MLDERFMADSSRRRKSWADFNGIRAGALGDVVDGITICEKNRATVYERYREGITELRWYLQNNYRDKGIRAVLYGIDNGTTTKYAVFVASDYLLDVGDNIRCSHCEAKRNKHGK